MLNIALPKGRIAKETLEIFEQIFQKEFRFVDRKLILESGDFRFLLVRNQDVPTYVEFQAADIGIVGLDVLEEKSSDVLKLLDLKIGKCKVCVGSIGAKEIDYSKSEIVIATKMENIAKNYFSKKAVATNIIKLYGSIELAPLVGMCDGIVDIVETGQTMRENNLGVVEEIMDSSAHLIANKNSFIIKKREILNLYEKIDGIVNPKSGDE
jgi:ATP phosphoribosyltransferase